MKFFHSLELRSQAAKSKAELPGAMLNFVKVRRWESSTHTSTAYALLTGHFPRLPGLLLVSVTSPPLS
jgi:hypothetical protein